MCFSALLEFPMLRAYYHQGVSTIDAILISTGVYCFCFLYHLINWCTTFGSRTLVPTLRAANSGEVTICFLLKHPVLWAEYRNHIVYFIEGHTGIIIFTPVSLRSPLLENINRYSHSFHCVTLFFICTDTTYLIFVCQCKRKALRRGLGMLLRVGITAYRGRLHSEDSEFQCLKSYTLPAQLRPDLYSAVPAYGTESAWQHPGCGRSSRR